MVPDASCGPRYSGTADNRIDPAPTELIFKLR